MEISILPFHTRNQTSFKGAELNKRAAQELETVVKPFLAQYKHPQYDSLMRQLAAKLQQFADSNVYIQPNYNTKQFKEVSRLKLGELDTNLEEFEYLTKKSENWFAGNNARAVAQTIKKYGLFEAPDFLSDAFGFYQKLKMDIKNGLVNMTYKKLAPEQYTKEVKLYNAQQNLFMSSSWYLDVDYYTKRIQKNLDNNSLTENIYVDSIQKISNAIKTHKRLLPNIKEATESAETINKEISVTPEDKAILSNLHKPAQRVISRNVSRFNEKVKNIKLSNEQENFLKELFKKQKAAIENLWNSIEEGKKAAFSPKEQNLQTDLHFDDDLPF